MSERCGRVVPTIEEFITIQFVGEKEEKYGLKIWRQCHASTCAGSHLCMEHIKDPLKVAGRDEQGNDVLVDFLGWPEVSHSQPEP